MTDRHAAFSLLAATIPLSLSCRGTPIVAIPEPADATTADAARTDGGAPDDSSREASSPDADADQSADADDAGNVFADVDAAPPGSYCSLPGSVVWTALGPMVMPGGADASAQDVSWLKLPVGFCAHYFGTVKTARQLRFSPTGDLFAASPTSGTTGGAGDGIAGIVILPDDNHDGNADSSNAFISGLPSVQGLMFANGYLYYQDNTTIRRVLYTGLRQPGTSEVVTSMTNWPQAFEHWPKVFDQAQDGAIYISNGGSQSDVCTASSPVRGAILKLNADGTTSVVAKGFRNPIAMRCEPHKNVCLVAELALDYSWNAAGREKVIPLRQGDDWGYPCCATGGVPYTGVVYSGTNAVPNCSGVAQDGDSFVIGHTPFGLDFETGKWPAPWTNRVFVTLHGDAGLWNGARVVAIALDPNGMPLPATELDSGSANPDNMLEFATGWDDGKRDHGRPAPVAFAPDGRLFVGDDQRGAVIWIAPVDLMR
ncbi:MAG: hypothetical protein M3O46_08670 [Myxococcota bacterium]|nr:hypothetical protein [Myxococcota bacterium]